MIEFAVCMIFGFGLSSQIDAVKVPANVMLPMMKEMCWFHVFQKLAL